MGWLNRLRVRQLRRSLSIIMARAEMAKQRGDMISYRRHLFYHQDAERRIEEREAMEESPSSRRNT
jgi:hypothetical protein